MGMHIIIDDPTTALDIKVVDAKFRGACLRIVGNNFIFGGLIKLEKITILESICWSASYFNRVSNVLVTNLTIMHDLGSDVFNAIESNVTLGGISKFQDNQGGLVLNRSTLVIDLHSDVKFKNNTIIRERDPFYSSTLHAEEASIVVHTGCTILFEQNFGQICGGMTMVGSTLNFTGISLLEFSNNEGTNGGAMALYDGSLMTFEESATTLRFLDNRARQKGGAIYIDDSGYTGKVSYFFYKPFLTITPPYSRLSPTLQFANNTAILAGNIVFGGWVNRFILISDVSILLPSAIKYFDFLEEDNDLSVISSSPFRVCLCTDSTPNCTLTSHRVEVFPGQKTNIDVVAVGQEFGTTPTTIQLELELSPTTSSASRVASEENVQLVNRYCTTLSYTMFSSNNMEVITLVTDRTNIPGAYYRDKAYTLLFTQFKLHFVLKNCSAGFVFDNVSMSCICSPILHNHGIQCNMQTYTIIRSGHN